MMDSHQKKAFSDHTTIGSGIILKKKKKRKNELQMQVDCIQHHDSAIMFLSNSHHLHGINCAPRFPHNGMFTVHTALWHEQDQSN